MNPVSDPITDRNRELLEAVAADLRALRDDVRGLVEAWREYEPVVGAFRRGGMLAARTAARNGKRQ